MHNLARSIEHAGYVLIEMIPRVYDTARTLRILGEDGSVRQVRLDPSMPRSVAKQQTNGSKAETIHNLNVGRYDVAVTVGPGYSTRRQEAAEGMVTLAQANPQVMSLAGDLMGRNMDWPGADKIADRLKRAIPPRSGGRRKASRAAIYHPRCKPG